MDLPVYSPTISKGIRRLPPWLTKRLGPSDPIHAVKKDLSRLGLHTVCEEARCPNLGECWSQQTATIMILGDVCTRHCGFCSVEAGRPEPIDPAEPIHVAEMVEKLGLKHVVITCVARDDLADHGASHFVQVIEATRQRNAETKIEILTTDFGMKPESMKVVCQARPDVFNHNLETVERLSPGVRHRASYRNSLEFLRRIKMFDPTITIKSGMMLGLGETRAEVRQALRDLRSVGCQIVTIGQYLQPEKRNLPVVEYLHPDVFAEIGAEAHQLGFEHVASGPYVRSSYHAGEML